MRVVSPWLGFDLKGPFTEIMPRALSMSRFQVPILTQLRHSSGTTLIRTSTIWSTGRESEARATKQASLSFISVRVLGGEELFQDTCQHLLNMRVSADSYLAWTPCSSFARVIKAAMKCTLADRKTLWMVLARADNLTFLFWINWIARATLWVRMWPRPSSRAIIFLKYCMDGTIKNSSCRLRSRSHRKLPWSSHLLQGSLKKMPLDPKQEPSNTARPYPPNTNRSIRTCSLRIRIYSKLILNSFGSPMT